MATRKKPVKKTRADSAKTPRKRPLLALFVKLMVLGGLVVAGLLAIWAYVLNERVVDRFSGTLWKLPATVFAAPQEIYVGQHLSPSELIGELTALHYRDRNDLSETGTFDRVGNEVRIHRRAFDFPDGQEPDKQIRVRFVDDDVRSVTDANGADIGITRLEPMMIGQLYPDVNEDRILLNVEQVQKDAPLLIKTLITTEDRDFYHHHGVVPSAVLRALMVNLVSGHTVQGGSTITQQLAKNLFLTPKRTIERKVAEMIMALEMEWHYSKDKILEGYLNEVYLGQDGSKAIHGFGLAARYYFGRPVDELRPEEIALLVGMVKGASYYNPRRNPERAKNRRDTVIDLMANNGLISETEAGELKQRPLGVLKEKGTTSPHPAFLNLVQRQLAEQYKPEDLKTKGLRIFTTMQPRVQAALEHAVDALNGIEKARKYKPDTLQTAGIITSIGTGEVQALIGGRDPTYEGYNRALDAQRQIGSLIKPAIYLTALSDPAKYSLITLLDDSPITIDQKGSEPWTPKNYGGKFLGPTPLYMDLAESRNVPSIKLGMDVGLDNVADTLHKLGGPEIKPFFPAMLLGSMTMTPFTVAQIYQTLSSDGFYSPLRAIRSVVDSQGKPLSRYPLQVTKVADPNALYLLQYAMQGVVSDGTARSLNRTIPPSVGVAGKTGTTNDSRDAWFAGFTGNRVGVVWVGRDDDKPTSLTGASGALPVWAAAFKPLYNKPRDMTPPKGISFQRVDVALQARVPQTCPGILMPFVSGYEPQAVQDCQGTPTGGASAPSDNPLNPILNFFR
ncbi:penicillin-binding protein 1B [Halothiobacillus diazotrophicus]|uniref:penicillin-binding protein 1B n=1 Tax=Halothiobacillus diazotrophicus TaxID=1860122 RepID=UPI000ABC0A55|nr:penicillin-binding protein 1B [Halothiobacillus diazotrophicus]